VPDSHQDGLAIASRTERLDIDVASAPFDRLKGIHRLASDRSGREADSHARHQLYAARDTHTAAGVLVKVPSKPGLVYEQNLANEAASLSTIKRELPTCPYFPDMIDHGRLADGRMYLVMSLFEEFPLATTIGTERFHDRMVSHLRTALELTQALTALHRLPIFHVDLNPMNILYRREKGNPIIRIVDFESSYEPARHAHGTFYSPPTTPGYSAPEISRQAPDARSDIFSLGAVLYTMIAGFAWTWEGEIGPCVTADRELEPELRNVLSRAVDADPVRRYESVEPFRDAIAAYLERIWPGRSW
jgi:serine/threonine protein kinase